MLSRKKITYPDFELSCKEIFTLIPTIEDRKRLESLILDSGFHVTSLSDVSDLLNNSHAPRAMILDYDCVPSDQINEIFKHYPNSLFIVLSSAESVEFEDSSRFLVLQKPVSSDEIFETLKRQLSFALQIAPFSRRNILNAAVQLATSTSHSMIRISALKSLQMIINAQGISWIEIKPNSQFGVQCSLPRAIFPSQVLRELPRNIKMEQFKIQKNKMILPVIENKEFIFAWGLKNKPTKKQLNSIQFIKDQSLLHIVNLEKLTELKLKTFIDDLTGLYNSRYMRFVIHNAVGKSQTRSEKFSLLFIDVDHFKGVNDSHGHLVGSEFLVAIGQTIRNLLRKVDTVCRYGGDEFVVMLYQTSANEAKEIAERIRRNIERRIFSILGNKLHVTVSIGIASFPDHAIDGPGLIRMADEAMYTVKKTSRNAVHLAYELKKTKTPRKPMDTPSIRK